MLFKHAMAHPAEDFLLWMYRSPIELGKTKAVGEDAISGEDGAYVLRGSAIDMASRA
jgi:hypothetical protein